MDLTCNGIRSATYIAVMNKRHVNQKTDALPLTAQRGRAGTTLVEFMMAVVIISLMAGAIYAAGFSVLRHSQTVTVTAAAHMLAKEGIEEIFEKGYDKLTGGDPSEQDDIVDYTTHRVTLTRTMEVIWHNIDGSVSSVPLATGYAEVVVRVSWQVPRTSQTGVAVMFALID